ncbi:SURF1 family protein [Kordiimonas aquimaris]|uniref:SURF1 family protein n=1 Tax=Kordiimonas aquimaris TaxID=707591 RepID=UPI0021CFAAED|nr:SURF1 family protein [Kordiimonas aquimaris]
MNRIAFETNWKIVTAVLSALAILIFLGTWQAQKIGPKTQLLKSIEQGMSADPMLLPVHLDDPQSVVYRRVSFDGVAADAPAIKVFGTNLKGKPGYSLYKPVIRQHGRAVMVNFGWIPLAQQKLPILPVGEITVNGVLMESAVAGDFTPPDNLEKNEWYTANVHEMAQFFGLSSKEYYHFRIFADHSDDTAGFPQGGQVRVDIPNDHFEYMLTWYGLALGLIGVFLAFSLKKKD